MTVSACCAASNPGRPHVRASASRCAQVRSYKYTSPRDTLLESLILHRFWNFAVEWFVPRWVAPNLLTLVGLLHAVIAYALLLVHSPDLDGGAPSWVYATCAACLFVYQTMDGMDGKQARRTGSGSPLGEVVDHGADAIAACVYGVFICDVFGLGWDAGVAGFGRWPAVAAVAYSRCTFALDSVTATYTGRLPVARLDAQELQIIVQLALLRNAAYGVELWKLPVRLIERTVPLGLVVVLLGAAGGAWSRANSAAEAIRGPPSPHLPKYEGGPLALYVRVLFFEIVLTAATAHCAHFPLCHAVTTVAFGETMIRVMHLRVSDPDFRPLTSAHASGYVAAAAMVPGAAGGERGWSEAGLAAAGAALVLAALWEYASLFFALSSQITGCLGLPSNPFVIRPAKRDASE